MSGWRGSLRMARKAEFTSGLSGNEVFEMKKPSRALHLIGPALICLALFILAWGMMR